MRKYKSKQNKRNWKVKKMENERKVCLLNDTIANNRHLDADWV